MCYHIWLYYIISYHFIPFLLSCFKINIISYIITISYYIILYPIISHVPKLQPGTTFIIAPGCNSFESWDSSINRGDHNQLSLHDWYITLYNWRISGHLWPLLLKMKEWWKIRTCSDRRYLFSFSLFSWKRLWLIDSVASWYPSGCLSCPPRKGCPLQPFPASKAQRKVWDQRGFCHWQMVVW
jgi:hypothetical protein